jgi:predicted aldo/keto reductase-like oxidoreductase
MNFKELAHRRAPVPAKEGEIPRYAELKRGCPLVGRLGLATRGNTRLAADDVAWAVSRGVNYLNGCGYDDGIAQALRERHVERESVVVAMQLAARDASSAAREIEAAFRLLGTERLDVVTFYYVEEAREWEEIAGPGGAFEALEAFRRQGHVGLIGLTTHQRTLGAKWAASGSLDLLMVRYNAAHRGAERDVFPLTDRCGIHVVVFTAEHWGALARGTPDDPEGFEPPRALEWYRFALANPSVSVVLAAPNGRAELEEDLNLLDDWRAPTPEEFAALVRHGERVRRHAGQFP